MTISDTRDKEFEFAKYEKEREKEKLISMPEEEKGMLKEYRNNVYHLYKDIYIYIYNVIFPRLYVL